MVKVTLQEGWKLFRFWFSCKAARNQQDLHFYKEPIGVTFLVAFMHLLSLTTVSCLGDTGRHQEKEWAMMVTPVFFHAIRISLNTLRCVLECVAPTSCACLIFQFCCLVYTKNKAVTEPKNASCWLYTVQMHKQCICFW